MFPSIPFLLHLWVGFLCLGTFKISSCVGDTNVGCVERERQALTHLKQDLKDPGNRLSSWMGDDCCGWTGIRCDNKTGHVVKLILRNRHFKEISTAEYLQPIATKIVEFEGSCISGEINPSLLELKYLEHLDLSFNCFGGIGIPNFIGSFKNLRYLNLSKARFGGSVPHELGNLSTLHYLDLNNDDLISVYTSYGSGYTFRVPSYDLHVDRLHWLSHLTSLKHLNMGSLNLSTAADWLLSINMLPSILNLQMSSCNLPSISTSLAHVNLTYLSTLDLSSNRLGPRFPTWLFNLSRIMSVNLDHTHLGGSFPTALRNLCNLRTLSLYSSNGFEGEVSSFEECFRGCIQTSLEDLNLGYNELSGHLPDWLGQFTKLKSLDLYWNYLSGPISPSFERLSSLRKLNIAENNISGSIPSFLGKLSSLEELDLGGNSLSGSIPSNLGRLSSLRVLDLSKNSLSGSIPPSLGRLSSLRTLSLFRNKLNGTIPEHLGQLSKLVHMELQSNSFGAVLTLLSKAHLQLNSFEGVLSEAHFSNLTNLKILWLASNSLILNVSSNWVPPFSLLDVDMKGCKLGPQFPPWLQTQKELQILSLSNTSISDTIPDFFWSLTLNMTFLDLSHNLISGSIFRSIGESATNLKYLILSSNRLHGSIPWSICKMKDLVFVLLSNNHLTGEIPRCLGDSRFIRVLNLENNNLTGDIPSSISHLSLLGSLHLSNNKFSGELPPSMQNCTELVTLALGENGFSGKIPKWIGEKLRLLKFLVLRSNMFDGGLPLQLSQLSELQVLDLSQNKLSGTIPASFGNFSSMTIVNKTNEFIPMGGSDDVLESILVSWKGGLYGYSNTISLVINMNLAGNDLHGEIPREITRLFGMQSLNLSRNHLIGTMPETIGDLRWLESLDLSWNQLSGAIPVSLSNMTFLSHLNLSYNNFSGRVPSGNQFNSIMDSSIYIGNHFLCGPPLLNRCLGDETSPDSHRDVGDKKEAEEKFVIQLFYIAIAPGFVVGFWVVCGILLFKRSWRIAYYRFFDDTWDRLYFPIAMKFAQFKKKEAPQSNRGLPNES